MLYRFSTLDEFKSSLKGKNAIFLAAAGKYGNIIGEYFNRSKISWLGYLDKDENKQGKFINGKRIYGYDELINYPQAGVVICTIMADKEIESVILSYGIEDSNIIRFGYRNIFDLACYANLNPQQEIEKITKLKAIAKNRRRCFIVATGPSLTMRDLEMLQGEFCISVNSITRCFSKTTWRPNCYVVVDPAAYEECIKPYGIEKLSSECEYLVFGIKSGMYSFKDYLKNIYFFNSLDEPYEKLPQFSDDAYKGLFEAGTVIYCAIQLAVYMGLREIYMVGADLGFAAVKNREGLIEYRNMTPAVADFLKGDEKPIYEEDKIICGYRAARQFAEKNNIVLKNATRGGYLEELERVSLDDLLSKK